MDKRIIAIGGGEIRNKTTLEIDRYIASLAKMHAGEKRANALFLGTASHDSMPYFNSFRKTYTSVFDIKAEVGLMVYGEMSKEKIAGKIAVADCIYIGGGDTLYMLDKWKELGVDKMLVSAYEQGKIICGLSTGAICWFKTMYTDSEMTSGKSDEYAIRSGLGVLEGAFCPHFNEREGDFIPAMKEKNIPFAYAVENDCAIEFVNGEFAKTISAGGNAYFITNDKGNIIKRQL